jgi:hypothetical protein
MASASMAMIITITSTNGFEIDGGGGGLSALSDELINRTENKRLQTLKIF